VTLQRGLRKIRTFFVQLKNRGVKLLNPKTERKQREECIGGRAKAVKPLTFLTPDFLSNR
jgi:hypothetical protein